MERALAASAPTPVASGTLFNPTLETLAAMKTVAHIMGHVGLNPDAQTSLLELMGAEQDTDLEALSFLPDDFFTCLKEWKIKEAKAPPLVVSRAGLVGRYIRLKTHGQDRYSTVPPTRDDGGEAGTTTSQSTPALSRMKVKLSQTLDQYRDTEVDMIKRSTLQEAYNKWFAAKGGEPHPDREITMEQASALMALIDAELSPYVDLAVWGPHANRILKKLRMQSLRPNGDGTWSMVELWGPPSFKIWQKCWKVFGTGAEMFELISQAVLELYEAHIEHFHDAYGPEAWPYIYQCDVRAREEQWERVRRRAARDHKMATDAGGTTPFNPNRPWDYTLRLLKEDIQFWQVELIDSVLVHVVRPHGAKVITPAAPVVAMPAAADVDYVHDEAPRQHNPGKRYRHQQVGPTKDANGHYITNKNGETLCPWFGRGHCDPATGSSRCPHDPSLSHQCYICLQNSHPGSEHGKGKGKGAKKGGKGKGAKKGGKGKGGGKPWH